MVKTMIKRLFFLCMLMLGGYIQLSAHHSGNNMPAPSIKYLTAAHKNLPCNTPLAFEKQASEKVTITPFEKEEDDESFSLKKQPDGYSASASLTLAAGPSVSCAENLLPVNRHSSFASPGLYLIFHVFRI
jgi:hypothetical protein